MTTDYDFLAGGGEMGERIRAFDWSKTSLGPVESWPQSLRSAVSICLGSRFPIVIYWGLGRLVLYNDAYAEILGKKHPWALGRACREVWSEIWDVIAPMLDGVMSTGDATWSDDQLLFLERRGYPEECYFSFSFSPVWGANRGVDGIFTAVIENTRRVLGERRLRNLRELGTRTAEAGSAEEVCREAAAALATDPDDVPFSLLYLFDRQGQVRLEGLAGVERAALVRGREMDVLASCREGLASEADVALLVAVPPATAAERALVLPISSGTQTVGALVAGTSRHLSLAGDYRDFFDLAAARISAAMANARTHEEEKKRAEALAEIDRAKTAFFSNVSHEFRTPLTLMLGPLEEELAGNEALPALTRQRLETAHRNSLRLLKLVNSLLDFSRIEAGRTQASYEPVDLAALTADLASNFSSACERAGLRLEVDCPPLAGRAYVDREMWERIVLNLISNAFKFTFEGAIAVSLRDAGQSFELTVRDSGVGIPVEELPRMFERFHRVAGSRGRSHEGSGIGLALVQELVKLHGGAINVQSVVGEGTTFTVSVPKGSAHLPADRIETGRAGALGASGAGAYVNEALSWLPASDAPPAGSQPARAQRILFADDNADLRDYARRLLGEHYEVEVAADGEAALAAARARRPALIVTDVMMPRLDGFGLIRELRADSSLRDIPVVVLSARAGEEARIEGLSRGADDYLVKPFSARELLVRVEAMLQSAEVHRKMLEEERQATDVLREADRRKDEFLATLSHELRNPLTPICNVVELLATAHGDAELLAQARGILTRQVNALVRLVDDLLDVSRISQGSVVLRKKVVDLAAVVAGAVETSRPAIDAAGHELALSLPEKPVMLYVDSVRIAQILTNLLNNAAKYTRRGGRIELTARREGAKAAISVRDNGVGVAPELLPRIFGMFVQGADMNGPAHGGLGIGLWLARTIAEGHGGSIEARSEGRGRGSEFVVRLPALEPGELKDSLPKAGAAAGAPQARRVLVVEDNVDAAESLGLLLRQMGHEVRVAYDGHAAVRAASEHAPDVVLLDLSLPDIDGYVVAERLRGELRLSRVPIVAVTGRGREEDRERSREAGFHGHLMKPVAADALRAVLSGPSLSAHGS